MDKWRSEVKTAFIVLLINIFILSLNAETCQSRTAPERLTTVAQQDSDLPRQNGAPTSCDCCVFDEAPPDLWQQAKIASDSEPGERLTIKGVVYESDGVTPAKDVLIYLYHADAKGTYAKRGDEDGGGFASGHGRNRGWVRTGQGGEYEIDTIKPAPYAAAAEPARIQAIVRSPSQKNCYKIQDFVFKDDPRLKEDFFIQNARYYEKLGVTAQANYDGVELTKGQDGRWLGARDIRLYEEYDLPKAISGRAIGESSPAFEPQHVGGPDKGTRACPMCVYGNRQGVLFWLNSDSDWGNAKKLAKFLDEESERRGVAKFKSYLIYTNPQGKPISEIDETLTSFAKELNLKHLAVTYVPSATDAKTTALNEINPSLGNTLILYKKRKVFDKFLDFEPSEKNLRLLTGAVNRAEGTVPLEIKRKVHLVPIQIASDLISIMSKINGVERLVLVDTGSPGPVQVSSSFAASFNPTERTNGRIRNLVLGDYERKNVEFQISENRVREVSKALGAPVDAILGWKFLAQNHFAIDYQNRVIRISEAAFNLGETKMQFNFSIANGIPIVEGLFGQDQAKLLVDTSSRASLLSAHFGGRSVEKSVNREVNIEGYRIPTLWQSRDLSVGRRASGYDAVIGNNLLNKYIVYFDTRNNFLHFY